jgi:hypothetical protein
LIISNVASTALTDAALDMSRRSKTERVMASLVRVMKGAFYIGLDGSPKAPGFEELFMRSWVYVNGIDIQEEIGRQWAVSIETEILEAGATDLSHPSSISMSVDSS